MRSRARSLACEVVLIGGPYDGAEGLGWVDDVSDPLEGPLGPPPQIVVGRCVGRICEMDGCESDAHVAYWDALEAVDVPVATEPYTRVSVTRRLARYVHGSVWLSQLGHRDEVTAGMGV